MKASLRILTILLLLGCGARADLYMADGVDPQDVMNSERFYDAAKGNNWTLYSPHNARNNLATEWKAHGSQYDFLGEYGQKFDNSINDPTHYAIRSRAANLIDDGSKCWAYTSSNVIQYWQDTYGVFYRGDKELVCGLSYDKQYLQEFEGIQSTKISMVFHENTNNTGGFAPYAFDWWMRGQTDSGDGVQRFKGTPEDSNGYFNEYFTSGTYGHIDVVNFSPEEMKESGYTTWEDALATALGYEKTPGGYEKTVEGQIAYLGLNGHATTCYGFETDADGSLSAVYLANSDNPAYSLDKYYVKYQGYDPAKGYDYHYYLYTDEECTQQWDSRYLESIDYINTPQVLQDMLKEYRSSSLVWGEGSGAWTPDGEVTGRWTAHAGTATQFEDDYAAGFTNGRDATFAEAVAGRSIAIEGAVQAGTVTIRTAAGLKDTFTPQQGGSLSAKSLVKEGAGLAELHAVMGVESIAVTGGSLSLLDQAESVGLQQLTLAAGTTLSVYSSYAEEENETLLALGKGATLTIGSGAVLNADLSLAGVCISMAQGGLQMGSALTLGGGNVLEGTPGVFATGVDSLVLGDAVQAYFDAAAGVKAEDYFSNLGAGEYVLYYSAANGGTVGLARSGSVPEPGTGALALLALAAAVVRRRR